MKCKYCGHEMKQTYFDKLKLLFEGGLEQEDWDELICGGKKICPFKKICKFPENICFTREYEEFLLKEVKP